MSQPAVACDRCGRPLALHQAWILIQDDETSTLCEPCALDVGPALTTSPGTRLVPPGPPPAPPPAEPSRDGDGDGGLANRHPIVWILGSLCVLALAITPFVFFYWLTTR